MVVIFINNNNIFKYINKYGDLSFEEKEINEVDILIFSQISYLDYSGAFKEEGVVLTLTELWNITRKDNKDNTALVQRNTVRLLDAIYMKKRYRDLLLRDYVYILEEDTQFGVISIVYNNTIYVSFEGTDSTIWGWKEDFELSYIYPTMSQKYAGEYLNKIIKFNGPKVVVCGHSKGGNLALAGSMNTKLLKKFKIKSIYSFDGPGLKEEEYRSLNYKLIRNKLINIIPSLSFVGVLLNQENVIVIKSKGIGIMQHDATTWQIEDDHFKLTTQDKLSLKFDESICRWMEKYDYKERKEIIDGIFSIFITAGIKSFNDINNLEIVYKIVKTSHAMSKETKEIIMTAIKFLITDFGSNVINDSMKELQNNVDKFLKKINIK